MNTDFSLRHFTTEKKYTNTDIFSHKYTKIQKYKESYCLFSTDIPQWHFPTEAQSWSVEDRHSLQRVANLNVGDLGTNVCNNKYTNTQPHKYTAIKEFSLDSISEQMSSKAITQIIKYTTTQIRQRSSNKCLLQQLVALQTELDGEIWDPNWKVSSWKIEHHHHWSELAASLINNFKGLGVRMRRGGTSYAKHKSLSYKKHRRISN